MNRRRKLARLYIKVTVEQTRLALYSYSIVYIHSCFIHQIVHLRAYLSAGWYQLAIAVTSAPNCAAFLSLFLSITIYLEPTADGSRLQVIFGAEDPVWNCSPFFQRTWEMRLQWIFRLFIFSFLYSCALLVLAKAIKTSCFSDSILFLRLHSRVKRFRN